MKREEILAMQPGHDLDTVVAVKVIGRNWFRDFRPSTKWDSMSDVVDIMRDKKARYLIDILGRGDGYSARFWRLNSEGTQPGAIASTIPEAVCKAALLAMMSDTREGIR